MARKPVREAQPAFSPSPRPQRQIRRAQVDLSFENQSLLGVLFGQFDANLVQVENRLGVFISARGDRLHIEGPADSVARAREVLLTMYDRLALGQELDSHSHWKLHHRRNTPSPCPLPLLSCVGFPIGP